jgi:hypothetical protein
VDDHEERLRGIELGVESPGLRKKVALPASVGTAIAGLVYFIKDILAGGGGG